MYEYTYIRMTIIIFSLPTTLFYHYFSFSFFFKYLIQCYYNIKHDNKIIYLFYQKFNWFLIKFIDIISCICLYDIQQQQYIISLFCYYANIYLSFLIFFILLLKSINSVRWNLILTIFIIDCYMTMVSSYTRRSL